MPYCPEPDCPHRKRTGQPAEYRQGQQRCSDCQSQLVPDNPVPTREKIACPAPLKKRLWFTLAVMIGVWLAFSIPPPFVNLEALQGVYFWNVFEAARHFGPCSLGLNSFVVGFILMELFALAWPKLRRRRHADPDLRRRLWRASLVTGLILTLVQGFFVALSMQNIYIGGLHRAQVVENPGAWFLIVMTVTLAAGSCLLVAAAHLISRFGVGSGFAVVILCGYLEEIPYWLPAAWRAVVVGGNTPTEAVVLVGGSLGLFLGMWWFMHRGARLKGKLTLRLPTCGTLPLETFLLLALLPNTLYYLIHSPWLTDLSAFMTPGSSGYLVTGLVSITIFAFLASGMFYWRRRAIHRQPEMKTEWFRARLYSTGFLLAMLLFWHLLTRLTSEGSHLIPAPLTMLIAVAIIADLRHEIRARWQAPGGADLVARASFQDLPDALEARSESGGALQGAYFRSLAYFFGPYVPLVVLDPKSTSSRAASASESPAGDLSDA